jgi:alcohol dehydrogenase (NADP+)
MAGREMFCGSVTTSFDGLDQETKTRTYGGYSTSMVVEEDHVLKIPEGSDLAGAAPLLLCAGITTYSPPRRNQPD